MAQTISLVRGSTTANSSTSAFVTLLTVPSASTTAARVIIGGLSLIAPNTNTALNYRYNLNHATSDGVHSPISFFAASSTSVTNISPMFIDGGNNATYAGGGRPVCVFVSNTGTTSLVPTSSGAGPNLTAIGWYGNNVKNIWMGPGDTMQLSVYTNTAWTVTVNYMFILIRES